MSKLNHGPSADASSGLYLAKTVIIVLQTLIMLGDGGHGSKVNKDGCQEFISCGTYPPCLDTAWTLDMPT